MNGPCIPNFFPFSGSLFASPFFLLRYLFAFSREGEGGGGRGKRDAGCGMWGDLMYVLFLFWPLSEYI